MLLSDLTKIPPDLSKPPPGNAVQIFSRLAEVYRLFSSKQRLRSSCYQCYEFYTREESNLISDLMRFPHITDDMMKFILLSYSKSSSIRAIVIQLLFDLAKARKTDEIHEFFYKMNVGKVIDNAAFEAISKVCRRKASKAVVASLLSCAIIQQAVVAGEPMIGALLAFQLYEKKVTVDSTTISMIISALSVPHPIQGTYHAFTIMKILQTFNFKLSEEASMKTAQFMLEDPNVHYFGNILYDKMDPNDFQRKNYVNISREVIAANIRTRNIYRALEVWMKMQSQDVEFAKQSTLLTQQLLETAIIENPEKGIELIEKIPADLHGHPDLIDAILRFYGKNPAHSGKFEALTRQLKPPLLRRTLSLVFTSFLSQNNETGAERILKTIFLTKNGLSGFDFNAIISKLLRQQKIKQSLKMCYKTDIEIAKYGYIRIMEYFLTHESGSDITPEEFEEAKDQFFTAMVKSFHIIRETDDVRRELTLSLFKHFSHHISNGASRKLYIVFAYPSERSVPSFSFENYALPAHFEKLVTIDFTNRLSCLSIILTQAKREQDHFTIKWCVEEMRTLGLPTTDIINYYLDKSMLNTSLHDITTSP